MDQAEIELENVGIYIHVPWCHRRCSYCDFYFEIGKPNAPAFIDALKREWVGRRKYWPPYQAKTLYFGGGTPSVLPTDAVVTWIELLKTSGDLDRDAQITFEANPEDLGPDYLQGLKNAGVNRLSLGVQGFDDSILKWLGRKHKAKQARQCVIDALDAGFEKLSVDLIIGIPDEQDDRVDTEVAWLSELGVGHISLYVLTVESNTPLARRIEKGKVSRPDDDLQALAYERAQLVLSGHGFQQYEISSFAKPGHESVHNRIYWAQGSYLGLGPGAHSMLLNADGSIYRRHTNANLLPWLKGPLECSFAEETLSPQRAFLESLAFGMRDMGRGINISATASRHKCGIPATLVSVIENLIDQKWLCCKNDRLYLTALGARFADAVAREILGIQTDWS